eukprot:354282_1
MSESLNQGDFMEDPEYGCIGMGEAQNFGDYYMDKIDNGQFEDVMDDTVLHAFMNHQVDENEAQYLFNTRFSDATHNAACHAEIEHQVYEYYEEENPEYAKEYGQNNCYHYNSQTLLKDTYGYTKQYDQFPRHWPQNHGFPSCEEEAYLVHKYNVKSAQIGRSRKKKQSGGGRQYNLARE